MVDAIGEKVSWPTRPRNCNESERPKVLAYVAQNPKEMNNATFYGLIVGGVGGVLTLLGFATRSKDSGSSGGNTVTIFGVLVALLGFGGAGYGYANKIEAPSSSSSPPLPDDIKILLEKLKNKETNEEEIIKILKELLSDSKRKIALPHLLEIIGSDADIGLQADIVDSLYEYKDLRKELAEDLFKKVDIKDPKLKIGLINCLGILEESKDISGYAEKMISILTDPSSPPSIRNASAYALNKINSDKVKTALLDALKREKPVTEDGKPESESNHLIDPREGIIFSLSALNVKEAVEPMLRLLINNDESNLQETILESFQRRMKGEEINKELERCLTISELKDPCQRIIDMRVEHEESNKIETKIRDLINSNEEVKIVEGLKLLFEARRHKEKKLSHDDFLLIVKDVNEAKINALIKFFQDLKSENTGDIQDIINAQLVLDFINYSPAANIPTKKEALIATAKEAIATKIEYFEAKILSTETPVEERIEKINQAVDYFGDRTRKPLLILTSDSNPEISQLAKNKLKSIMGNQFILALINVISSTDTSITEQMKINAANLLGEFGDKNIVADLERIQESFKEDGPLKAAIESAVQQIHDREPPAEETPTSIPDIVKNLDTSKPLEVQLGAIKRLGETKSKEAINPLLLYLGLSLSKDEKDKATNTQRATAVFQALANLPLSNEERNGIIDNTRKKGNNFPLDTTIDALIAMIQPKPEEEKGPLVTEIAKGLEAKEIPKQLEAIRALGETGQEEAIAILIRYLASSLKADKSEDGDNTDKMTAVIEALEKLPPLTSSQKEALTGAMTTYPFTESKEVSQRIASLSTNK